MTIIAVSLSSNKKKGEEKIIKAELYTDSHGRGLPKIIECVSEGTVKLSGLVSPGAGIQQVLNNAAKSQISTLLIIAGTNDVLKRSTTVFYKTIEDKLKKT